MEGSQAVEQKTEPEPPAKRQRGSPHPNELGRHSLPEGWTVVEKTRNEGKTKVSRTGTVRLLQIAA